MEKEVQQHIIYGVIILIVAGGLFAYFDSEITKTQTHFNTEVNILHSELATTQEEITSLQEKVGIVQTDLIEKSSAIVSLNENLQKVQTESQENLGKLEDKVRTLKSTNQDFSDVIEEVIPGVVSIITNTGSGSGFFVRGSGYIATNYHVIKGATAAQVTTSNGNNYDVRVVGYDKNADIAVLYINETGLKRLSFANSGSVKVGEKVIAVGSPVGLDYTVTQGIVSSAKRVSDGNIYVQIDVPINPGNSGGPLINGDGKVVGINTLKLEGYEGLGFALEADFVKNIIDDIISQD